MKETLVRDFSVVDSETLKCSGRNEWPAMLHNLCYIHSAVRLRARYDKAGFNVPYAFDSVGAQELFVSTITVSTCYYILFYHLRQSIKLIFCIVLGVILSWNK